MSQQLIDRVLAGTWQDPEGTGVQRVPTRKVVIGTELALQAAALVESLEMGRRLAVVMDVDTKNVMGDAVLSGLSSAYDVTPVVLGHHPHPDMDAVRKTVAACDEVDSLVAVGSGSINDITKHAAHLRGKPFAVFGTAPSMNGYTSTSAAITEDGLKKSLSSTAARGVFLDLDILAAAPRRLIAAGFGDSICRSTAQVDWLLSHLLLGTPYREAPFALLKDDEARLVANPRGLLNEDANAIAALARTLVLSGFGMSICGGSYPASQSEHLIAHYIDMFGRDLPLAYHGEHIAVTTLTAARLQERLLSCERLRIATNTDTLPMFEERFGPDIGKACWDASAPKRLKESARRDLQHVIDMRWNDIRARLRAVARPAAEIEDALRDVGAPVGPQDVGIDAGFYGEALRNSRLIRDRYGILDLAESAGELEKFIRHETARAV